MKVARIHHWKVACLWQERIERRTTTTPAEFSPGSVFLDCGKQLKDDPLTLKDATVGLDSVLGTDLTLWWFVVNHKAATLRPFTGYTNGKLWVAVFDLTGRNKSDWPWLNNGDEVCQTYGPRAMLGRKRDESGHLGLILQYKLQIQAETNSHSAAVLLCYQSIFIV